MAVSGRFQQSSVAAPTSTYAYAMTGVAVASIWVSVILTSIFAPDFVSGSQQEHLPLIPWGEWLWGAIATSFVVLAAINGMRKKVMNRVPWIALGVGVGLTWLAVMLVSVFAPVFVTGSDPTRIPLAAMGAPIAGVFLTWFTCTFVKTAFEG